MKKNKYFFVLCMLLSLMLAGGIFTTVYVKQEDKKLEGEGLQIVTSFYPMYIAAENIVGSNKKVSLENLSEPQTGCLHDYQLTPQDMILLSKADVFIVNGGGIESFLEDVAKAYPNLSIIEATKGLDLIEDNAHGWMDTDLYHEMVTNIAVGLGNADKENKDCYQKNAREYGEKILKLSSQIKELKEVLSGQDVIIFHEAYEYVARQYGMNVTYCLDLDEERQVSAGEVADVMAQIEEHGINVILAEELYGKSMGDTVQLESECQVHYLDSLVRGVYEKDSYLKAMQKNITIMKEIAGKDE
ncbi:MAG: metal ABC transporter substrate-binding protein [Lachnospiraceae bacterium]